MTFLPSTSTTVSHAGGICLHGALTGEVLPGLGDDLAGAGSDGVASAKAGDAAWPGQLLVELVAADSGQVVAARIEEQVVDQALGDSTVGGSPGRSLR